MIDHGAELEILEKVTPGDAKRVSELYAIAAMWLRDGVSLHPDHAAWLADRLDEVAGAIESKEPKALPVAVWASGKRGRSSLDEADIGKRRIAVMLYQDLQGGMGHESLLKHVADRSLLTPDQVRDAWKKRENLFPDLFPVTP